MNTNPSYESNKQEQNQEEQYDYVAQDYLDIRQDTIKVDTNLSYETVHCTNGDVTIQENPSYGTIQSTHNTTKPEHDVTIQANPSYCSNLQDTKKALEDENKDVYNTKEANNLKMVKEEKAVYNEIDDININPNPSYASMLGGIELEDNPSYSYGIK